MEKIFNAKESIWQEEISPKLSYQVKTGIIWIKNASLTQIIDICVPGDNLYQSEYNSCSQEKTRAIAKTKAVIDITKQEDFIDAIGKNNIDSNYYLIQLLNKERAKNRSLLELKEICCNFSGTQKAALGLLWYARKIELIPKENCFPPLEITNQELAEIVCLDPHTISRAYSQLQDKNLISRIKVDNTKVYLTQILNIQKILDWCSLANYSSAHLI